MSSTLSKVLVAALAFGAAQALPQQPKPSGSPGAGVGPTENDDLIAELITKPSMIKRYQKLLTDDNGKLLTGEELDKTIIWDFNKNTVPVPGGNGGTNSMASVETFPYLIDAGFTLNIASLGPCGVFTPHVHPRANEFFTVLDGEVIFGTQLELGLQPPGPTSEIQGNLKKHAGTLFPQGSIHWQVNNSPDCKGTTILAVLSSNDPGTTPILQLPTGQQGGGNATLMPRAIEAKDVDQYRPVLLPQVAAIVDECLARCDK